MWVGRRVQLALGDFKLTLVVDGIFGHGPFRVDLGAVEHDNACLRCLYPERKSM